MNRPGAGIGAWIGIGSRAGERVIVGTAVAAGERLAWRCLFVHVAPPSE